MYSGRDPTGKLLCTSAQHLLLELGTADALFDHDFCRLGHIATHSWLRHTWRFFSEYRIKLRTTLPTLKPQCPGDKFLITEFQKYYKKGLIHLNRCHLYLQVTTLADITTADGKFISKAIWEG